MQDVSIDPGRQSHRFLVDRGSGERNTWLVIGFTAVMMIVEIASGLLHRIQPLHHVTVEVIPYVAAPEQFMNISGEPF